MRLSHALLSICLCGCYLSHGRSGDDASIALDAGTPHDAGMAPDAGAACEFSVRLFDGTEVRCSIASSSRESCSEAALCLCDAQGPMTEVELLQCAGWELTPRGALTFTDFCTMEEPARMSTAEALAGYFGGAETLTVSEACTGVPALLGPRPFDACAFLAEQLCPCTTMPCDLDALLGRDCLGLTREQVECVRAQIPGNAPCSANVPAIVRACGG